MNVELEELVIKSLFNKASESAEKSGYTDKDALYKASFVSGYMNSAFEGLLYDLNLSKKQQKVLQELIEKLK